MNWDFIEFLKVIFYGIVEGITTWLPISTTAHMLLVSKFVTFNISAEFYDMLAITILLGGIMAVIVVYFKMIFPYKSTDNEPSIVKQETFSLWLKIILAYLACFPKTVISILFNNYIDKKLSNSTVVAAALIIYGIAFITIEIWNKKRFPTISKSEDISYLTAILIGLSQILTLIPGTSRSATTIIVLMLVGVTGTAAAKFMFLFAIPSIFTSFFIIILKFRSWTYLTSGEWLQLAIGMVTAFTVSVLVIKFLMRYLEKHDFKAFGWYRIALGIVMLLVFTL